MAQRERMRRELANAEERARKKEAEVREKDAELKKAREEWKAEVGAKDAELMKAKEESVRERNEAVKEAKEMLQMEVRQKDLELKKVKEEWRVEVVKLRKENTLLEDRVTELLREVHRARFGLGSPDGNARVVPYEPMEETKLSLDERVVVEGVPVSERVQVVERLVEESSRLSPNQKSTSPNKKGPSPNHKGGRVKPLHLPPVVESQVSEEVLLLAAKAEELEEDLRLLKLQLEQACQERAKDRASHAEQLLLMKMKSLSFEERAQLAATSDGVSGRLERERKRLNASTGGRLHEKEDIQGEMLAGMAASRKPELAASGPMVKSEKARKARTEEAEGMHCKVQMWERQVAKIQSALSESTSELEHSKLQLETMKKALADLQGRNQDSTSKVCVLEAERTKLLKSIEELREAVHSLDAEKRQLKLDCKRAAHKPASAKRERHPEKEDGARRRKEAEGFRLQGEGWNPCIRWLEAELMGVGWKFFFGSGAGRMMTW